MMRLSPARAVKMIMRMERMTDIPIIFSAPMVLGLKSEAECPGEGKHMTRRLLYTERRYRVGVPGQNVAFLDGYAPPATLRMGHGWGLSGWHKVNAGDRLWVRENWKPHSLYARIKPSEIPPGVRIFYTADGTYAPSNTPWVPCIHMPRWASRLTLIITGTKIERLNDISERDARAESAPIEFRTVVARPDGGRNYHIPPSHRGGFANLWSRLHGKGSWEANPYIVAMSFRVIAANIDAPEARIAA